MYLFSLGNKWMIMKKKTLKNKTVFGLERGVREVEREGEERWGGEGRWGSGKVGKWEGWKVHDMFMTCS